MIPKNNRIKEETMYKKGLGVFVIVLAAVFCFAAGKTVQEGGFDILIKNGKIINGTGNPWYYGDIGIIDDKIVEIGNLSGKEASLVIDAKGLVVSPGFIDMHTHCDRGLGEPGSNANLNYLMQGTTTVRTGSCGSGTYKIAETKEAWERQGIGTNAVLLVGHNPVRRAAMGEEQLRSPAPEEVKNMQELVRQAMREGAWGISTGLEYGGYDKFVTTEEVIEVTKAVAEFGGVYTSHIRDEASRILDAIKETIRIGEETGVPVNVTHIKATGKYNWGLMKDAIQLIKDARARGVMVTADQYPFIQGAPIGSITSLIDVPANMEPLAELRRTMRNRQLSAGERKQARQEYVKELQKALADSTKRELLKQSTYEKRPDNPSSVARWGWQDFRFKVSEKNAHLVNRPFVDVIEEQKRDGFDVVADLILDEPGILFAAGSQSDDDMRHAMQQEFVMVSSDGGALPPVKETDKPVLGHPRQFSSQAIILRKYVREENLLTLEAAIRKMTSLPAQYIKMDDRGLLLEGYKADITIFNPDTVRDNASWDNAYQYATGVEYVIVNGKISVDKGKFNGALHGKVLLKQ